MYPKARSSSQVQQSVKQGTIALQGNPQILSGHVVAAILPSLCWLYIEEMTGGRVRRCSGLLKKEKMEYEYRSPRLASPPQSRSRDSPRSRNCAVWISRTNHFGPDVKQRFRDSLIGAIVAVMTWIGLSYLLGSYFRHFDSLDKTYGSLGAAIGLYVGFYLSGFAILAGGEINFLLGELRGHRILQSFTLARTQTSNRNTAA